MDSSIVYPSDNEANTSRTWEELNATDQQSNAGNSFQHSFFGGQQLQSHESDRLLEPGNTTVEEVQETTEDPIHLSPKYRDPKFKVRIVDIDHYMVPLGPLDMDSCQFLPPHVPVLKVPVVRVYGANEAGQKTCLHIHQAYPYFYVPYEGSLEQPVLSGFIQQLGMSLNRAAAIAFKAPQDLRRSQYVAAIVLVKGVPFYGYHTGYTYFLKIYLFNPDFESRIVELMRSGAVMGIHFQPFEAHVPFRLQFCIDYNLYGMGWVELEDALLRNDIPAPGPNDNPKRLTKATVVETRIWSLDNDPGRISHCEIEMDSTVDRIINRDRAPERDTHATLKECFQTPPGTAQVPSMAGLWEDDARRRRANNLPTQDIPKTQIRDPETIPWLNHDTLKHMVADMVQEVMSSQRPAYTPTPGDFEKFSIPVDPLEKSFMTAYQSIDFLCPREDQESEDAATSATQAIHDNSFVFNEEESSILVDESVIISQSAAMLEEMNMESRKEILKGLAGLRGIDEQDEDEDVDTPLNELDDLLNDDDLFDDLDFSDMDGMDDMDDFTIASPGTAQKDNGLKSAPRHIPQFDGGNDGSGDEKPKPVSANNSWKAASRTLRSKRGRGPPSLPALEKPSRSKSFCDIVTSTLAPSTSSEAEFVSTSTGTPLKFNSTTFSDTPSRSSTVHSSPVTSQRSTPTQKTSRSTTSSLKSSLKGRSLVRFVEIPSGTRTKKTVRMSLPEDMMETESSAPEAISRQGTADSNPHSTGTSVDDPIMDIDTDSDIELLENTTIDEVSKDNRSFKKRLLDQDFPEPVSPERQYFLSSLDGMWSSPSPPLKRPAFFFSPPRPTSPTLIHSQLTKDVTSPRRVEPPMAIEKVTDRSLGNLDSTGSQSQSQKDNGDSSRVNETILYDRADLELMDLDFDHDNDSDSNTAENKNSPRLAESILGSRGWSPEGEQRQAITADDSIILEPGDISLSQEAIEPLSSLSIDHPIKHDRQSSPGGKTGSAPGLPRVDENPGPESQLEIKSEPESMSYKFSIPPPRTHEVLSTFTELGLPDMVHQIPHFSDEADVPSRARIFGGKEFRLSSKGLKTLRPFQSLLSTRDETIQSSPARFKFWEPNQPPPSVAEVASWLKEEKDRVAKLGTKVKSATEETTQQRLEKISQLEGPTQKNPFGHKTSPTKIAGVNAIEKDYIDLLSMEVHCETREQLLPDPKQDGITAIFYCWQSESEGLLSNGWVPGYRVGLLTHKGAGLMPKLAIGRVGYEIHVANNEGDMLNRFITIVREMDPDILLGYEVNNLSWGYLVDRYQTLFQTDMSKLLSRVRPISDFTLSKSSKEDSDTFNSTHNSGLKIAGRHLFNVWRLIRGEIALSNYSFNSVVFHVLQQRIPFYSHETLTNWWRDGSSLHQVRVVRHYLHRVQYNLQLVESQELVSRTSEFARVFGVDFFSVISRGSQYKVESLMIRLAKPENYIMISPSRTQVGAQRAAEAIPMVMEPESGFYEDPMIVLDFQSLYPSIMIAYNYCYSTCLGRLGGSNQLGVTEYKIREGLLPLMQDHLQLAPNYMMYVDQNVRRGLLARMLSEILETRVMVKKAMKEYPDNKPLLKLLDARQLSLKFIANVTYGYTSASFSGRMPGIEIADSIVLSARETLERAIRFVNANRKWNARVVYGDTDSMFVSLKGRTREEAFEIGYDIAETITKMNPRPVKLKFEKVYHPCFLVTKKRYVGSSYETPQQKEPIFDAKGIETIRRDGVPAVQKIMERCIKTMFRTQDLSQVKSYFVRQMAKILEGRTPVPDLMFGKEVRVGGYSDKGVPPPGAIVSARRMEVDPRSEPQYGERVPYVVVYGDPGSRLTDQVVEPKDLLRNQDLRLNGEYYIRKQIIPSLERIFQLVGADVRSWYDEMPRVQRASPMAHSAIGGLGGSIAPTDNVAISITEMYNQLANAANATSAAAGASSTTDESSLVGAGTTTAGNASSHSGAAPFKPRRKGVKGFVSIGTRIDRYYQSQLCIVCGKLVVGQSMNKELCAECKSDEGKSKTILILQSRLSRAEKLFQATVDVCSSCCRAAPNGGAGVGSGVPVYWDEAALVTPANTGVDWVACASLECPVLWQRRKAQDGVLVIRSLTDRVITQLDMLDF